MPRPRKFRKVCCMPDIDKFGPLGSVVDGKESVIMSVDEYETIRLIDLEGLTQEECGEEMQVARTTVQGIYQTARKKIADSLVNGKILKIEGGHYKLCDGEGDSHSGRWCHRRRGRKHLNKR